MCESQEIRGYSYVNEELINDDYKCSICTDPFIDPVLTPTCNHMFCRSGIERILTDRPVCPLCRRKPILSNQLIQADPNVLNYLNELLIQCDRCGEINIQRYLFNEHMNTCPKVEVTCSASDLKCPWKGPRDQRNEHITRCTFELMRSFLSPLLKTAAQVEHIQSYNQQLQLHVNGLYHRCKQLEMKVNGSITPPLRSADIPIEAKWETNGLTVFGGNGRGEQHNQLYHPQGLYLDKNENFYVADFMNHRIIQWKSGETNGRIVAGGNGQGNNDDQLNSPTDMIVDSDNECLIICDRENRRVVRWSLKDSIRGETIISDVSCNCLTMDEQKYLYITDIDKHEVRRWKLGETQSIVVAGGNGEGNRHDQLSYPTFVFVDRDQTIYVSDYNNNRVMKWTQNTKEGIIVAGGQGPGASNTHSYFPGGVIVDQWGTVYVSDSETHRIMRWQKGATEGKVIAGGNDRGSQSNQLNRPSGLLFDKQGNLYVADFGNHRIQKFKIETTNI